MAWSPKPEQVCSEAGVYFTREDMEAYDTLAWPKFKTWRDREEFRFSNGIYKEICWFTIPGHFMIYKELRRERFPHIAKGEPGKIAYTENDVKGNRDIQTVTTIGRYLSRFHDYLTAAEKKHLVDEWNSHYDNSSQLTFSDDPETIALIYQNGPDSCMSKDKEDFPEALPFGKHPCEVYGRPGDLSIAFLGTVEYPVARAIVDVQKKYFVRAYGYVERMELKLKDAGFTKQPYWNEGTKLNLWQKGSSVLCPYLDGNRTNCNVIPSGEFLLITRYTHKGSIEADNTCGYIDVDSNTTECYHCNRNIYTDEDDYINIDGNIVCDECCEEHYLYCHLTGSYVSNDTDMAIFYDLYGCANFGQLAELEGAPRYVKCVYTYEVSDETHFYYHVNTTRIELNNGQAIYVANNLHDEAYLYYLEKGLIDVENDDEEDDNEEADDDSTHQKKAA